MKFKDAIAEFTKMCWRPVPRAVTAGNYKVRRESDGRPYLLLFDNKIAWYEDCELHTSECGWSTRTTRKALSYVSYYDRVTRARNEQRDIFYD